MLPDERQVEAAEVVLPCADLDETITFFVEGLGFRLRAIFPADDPSVAVLAGHGLRLRLERGAGGSPGRLRLLCRGAGRAGRAELEAPNGTIVELVDADPPLVLPPPQPSFVVSKAGADVFRPGRASMLYRDLVPGRQGGRFIVSHIRIPEGGPVPDYVHFHKVRFQMIYCHRGWVRVVYEDQGPPFVLNEGDCVLQPPEIRHRVLESSPGLEVIEVGCPAEHETLTDDEMALPSPTAHPKREFGGQRFVRHVAEGASWQPFRLDGFERRDTGIAAATRGLAGVCVARRRGELSPQACSHDAEFLFDFVLVGSLTLSCEGQSPLRLEAGDSFVMPAGVPYQLDDCADGLELLEVALPAAFTTTKHPRAALGG